MRLSLLANRLSAASPCRAAQMCLQSVLCPPHPHPAPTHTATLPDFVLAPGVHRQPKGGFVKSQGEGEAGSSGGGAPCPLPPHFMSLCLIPTGRVGVGRCPGAGQRKPGSVHRGMCWGGTDKIPGMNLLSRMVLCICHFSMLLGRFSSLTRSKSPV